MKSIFKTILFISLFFVVQQSLFAQDDNKTVTLTVSGSGKTQDEAKQSALRSAIEQAFGTFISARTEILNDQLVSDQITSIANGNIQSFSILNESQLPDGSWGVTLKTIVSVSKLTSFVQGKGIAIEIKGGLFSLNIKQQILNEQGEINAVFDLISLLHETMQNAFDYEIKSSDPISLDAENVNWEIPLQVVATANKNMDFCANYFINTLKALSLSSEEVTTYQSLNKKVFPILINYKNIKKEFFLRKLESVQVVQFFIDNWFFYASHFVVDSSIDKYSVNEPFQIFKNNYNGYHLGYSLEEEKKSYFKNDARFNDEFYKNYSYLNIPNYDKYYNYFKYWNLNIYKFNQKENYLNNESPYINFLATGQRAATFTWNDKRTLSQIEQMTGYEVKSSGISSQMKYGGLVLPNKNGNIFIASIMDLGKSYFHQAKKSCEEFVFNGYDDWRLPTIEELNSIYINLRKEGIGSFKKDKDRVNGYWSSSASSYGYSYMRALYFGIDSCSEGDAYPENPLNVRAVRSFNLNNKSVSKSVINEPINVDKKTDNNLTSASAVYNKYIEAIGGVKTIENINTVKMVSEHAGPGYKLISTEIKKPNKYKFIYQVPQKKPALTMVINGNNSYLLENSKKTKMDANDILEYFEETDPQYQIHQEIFGINRVFKQRKDNNHILSYSLGKNKEIEEYYDVNTGFLVKKIQTVVGKNGTSKNVEITEFEDYKEIPGFTGYKVPYIKRVKTNNEDVEVQKLVLIEINKDVSDNEFE